MSMMTSDFFGGAIVFGYWVIGLFFLKFWRRTRDSFFGGFAIAFFLMGLGRALESILRNAHAASLSVYLFRLLAFGVIVFVIVKKNISARKK